MSQVLANKTVADLLRVVNRAQELEREAKQAEQLVVRQGTSLQIEDNYRKQNAYMNYVNQPLAKVL